MNAVTLVAGDRHVAEEAVQEALARAWSRLDRGQRIESLPNRVAVVAFNLAKSHWRRVLPERLAYRNMPRTTHVMPDDEGLDLEQALAALPRRQREVTVLRYLMGSSTRETAELLGISEGTVKNSLSKARDALALRLALTDEGVSSDVEDR
jgi:RNA polymerase sigma factor (sigma-70 family)